MVVNLVSYIYIIVGHGMVLDNVIWDTLFIP
jgi:hypothetical protein